MNKTDAGNCGQCDKRVSIKLNGEFYNTVVSLAMFYRMECWAIKKTQKNIR